MSDSTDSDVYEYSSDEEEEEEDQLKAARKAAAEKYAERRDAVFRQFVNKENDPDKDLKEKEKKFPGVLSSVINEFWENSTNRGRWNNSKFATISAAKGLVGNNLKKQQDVEYLEALFRDRVSERMNHLKEQAKVERVADAKRKLRELSRNDLYYKHKARRLNNIIAGKAYTNKTALIF